MIELIVLIVSLIFQLIGMIIAGIIEAVVFAVTIAVLAVQTPKFIACALLFLAAMAVIGAFYGLVEWGNRHPPRPRAANGWRHAFGFAERRRPSV